MTKKISIVSFSINRNKTEGLALTIEKEVSAPVYGVIDLKHLFTSRRSFDETYRSENKFPFSILYNFFKYF